MEKQSVLVQLRNENKTRADGVTCAICLKLFYLFSCVAVAYATWGRKARTCAYTYHVTGETVSLFYCRPKQCARGPYCIRTDFCVTQQQCGTVNMTTRLLHFTNYKCFLVFVYVRFCKTGAFEYFTVVVSCTCSLHCCFSEK